MKKTENELKEKNEVQGKEMFNEQEKDWITQSEYHYLNKKYSGNYPKFILNFKKMGELNLNFEIIYFRKFKIIEKYRMWK